MLLSTLNNFSIRSLLRSFVFILAFSKLFIACSPFHVMHTNATEIKTSSESIKDELINDLVQPYKLQLDDAMNVILAELEEDLIKEQPESSLGNHIAEITYWCAENNSDKAIDFAISNYGGIRVPYINKGSLKVSDAYQIMPFDNYIVVLQVSGEIINELVDKMASNGGWPTYNLSYEIKDNQAQNIKIQGRQFDVNKNYTFALTDYLANGGDKLSFLKGLEHENTNVYLRDAIMNFWRYKSNKSEQIKAIKDGRVKIVE